jgi:transposase
MTYAVIAVERAMKLQEVMLRAMSGELSWLQAADILGMHPRSLRRWRARQQRVGYDGLLDRRRQRPSPRLAPFDEVERILRLYRDRYRGFNVRHFHQLLRRDEAVTLSYSFVKTALQKAGLVAKRHARGRHRRRREPRACLGELLHLDGSPHAWLALCPDQRQTLLAVLDDATKRLLYAQLHRVESTTTVMTALAETVRVWGLPIALYTDRAGWAFHTPKAGGPVDRTRLTHVGRALAHLGIEHIGAYSPQARGRGERVNRTLQDRLVHELQLAGIVTMEAANQYLRDRFIRDYDTWFSHPPADPTSAFVALGDVDLDQILCEEEERTVAPDNTVSFDSIRVQLAKQPGRTTWAGARVLVRRHLDGRLTVWRGPTRLGLYSATGALLSPHLEQAPNGRFRVTGAYLPPMRPRRITTATRARSSYRGPRLPVGPAQ